jgi:hypothetical protein
MKRVYADICKVEPQEDGTLKVYGFASSGAVDSDGETITPDAMKAAIPDYMKFGAVREMHQPMAAGTALHAEVNAEGKTEFSAHIVDPLACKKVTTGVYKGFSIGGKVTSRDTANKTIISGLKLVEVSLVDRPANPEALMTMYKAERDADDDLTDIAALLDNGEVTPAELLAAATAAKAAKLGGDAGAVGGAPVVEAPADGAVTKTDDTAGIKKGLYSVSRLAELLCTVGYLAEDAEYESQYEGDNSPIPAQLRDWFKQGAGILQGMAAEELAEMMTALQANLPDVVIMAAKGDRTEAVGKVGAKFSKDTQKALGAAHEAMKTAVECMDKLGYKQDDDADSAASVTDTKADNPAGLLDDTNGIGEDTNKAETLLKAAIAEAIAPLNASLEKLGKENDDLKAKVSEMGKRAAPGKSFLNAVGITKAMDSAPATTPAATDADLAEEGTFKRAEQEMQKVFQGAGRPLILGVR